MKKLEIKLENEIFELTKLSAPAININLIDVYKLDKCNANHHNQITPIDSSAEISYNDFNPMDIQILVYIVEPKTEADFNNCLEAIERAKRLHQKAQEIITYKKANPVYWQALKAKFYCPK